VNLCGFEVGLERPLFLIAGPDTLESEQLCLDVAGQLKEHTKKLGMPYIFKGSFDKANRTSGKSYRGPGMADGLKILEAVKKRIGVPVLTDVHEDTPIREVAAVVDVIQTPAFLCRQTNFIKAAASAKKPVNIKKGQFLSPWEMVFDGTHSVQLPGGQGTASGGQREFIPVLARAAVGAGVSGIFMETHPKPEEALCDGPNSWRLGLMPELLDTLFELDRLVKRKGFVEQRAEAR
jgi:2-dehydro-3-deoxyphosphooctonate aldolase (KDO 8-P synthase)